MKYNNSFDQQLKNNLNSIANTVETPSDLLYKIKTDVAEKEKNKKTIKNLFIFQKKLKTTVIASICIFLLTGGIVGAKSLINQYAKGFLTNNEKVYTSIDNELINSLGFKPKMPQTLPGGFERQNIEVAKYIDGSKKQTYDSSQKLIFTDYMKNDAKSTDMGLSLSISNTSNDSDMFSHYEEIQLNNILLNYKSYEVYVTSDDYELSEEELEKEKNDKAIFICVGGKGKKDIQNAQSIKWIDNGIYYLLTDDDYTLSKNDMIELAKYIINMK